MRFDVFHDRVGNGRYNPRYEQAITIQDKVMNDRHLEELKNEYLRKYSPPLNVVQDKQKLAKWLVLQEERAKDFAKRNEPKRYLNPLLRPMNGISADKVLRRNNRGNTAEFSSSWVGGSKTGVSRGNISLDANGRVINIKLGGPTKNNPTGVYTYGTTPEGLKKFFSGKSLGNTIAVLSRSPEGTTYNGLTKLWDVRKNPEKVYRAKPKRTGR